MPWLVAQPGKEECRRARKLKPAQMAQLEGLWKKDPEATLEQLASEPAAAADLLRVALRYQDAYEYQNVFGPLLQTEADYDKAHFCSFILLTRTSLGAELVIS